MDNDLTHRSDQRQPDSGPSRTPPAVGMSEPAFQRLGPIAIIASVSHPLWGRCYAAVIAAMAWGILLVAFSLSASERGLGTHRQLGLPPCGFAVMTGFPCPTCGMTTAFAHMAHGRPLKAMRCQPAGGFLALGTLVAALACSVCVVAGRYPTLNWYRVNATRASASRPRCP